MTSGVCSANEYIFKKYISKRRAKKTKCNICHKLQFEICLLNIIDQIKLLHGFGNLEFMFNLGKLSINSIKTLFNIASVFFSLIFNIILGCVVNCSKIKQ